MQPLLQPDGQVASRIACLKIEPFARPTMPPIASGERREPDGFRARLDRDLALLGMSALREIVAQKAGFLETTQTQFATALNSLRRPFQSLIPTLQADHLTINHISQTGG